MLGRELVRALGRKGRDRNKPSSALCSDYRYRGWIAKRRSSDRLHRRGRIKDRRGRIRDLEENSRDRLHSKTKDGPMCRWWCKCHGGSNVKSVEEHQ